MTVSLDTMDAAATPSDRRRRRRYSSLTGSDRWWLRIMVGVPAALHILLVWIPALLTVVLSFTEWDNLDPVSKIKAVGLRNYWQIVTIFDSDFFP
ncbi:MAG TPA: hypothetical protein VLD86_10460, partial [Ilumatobacteraceae bacterium]|nr:hypothetical protein [Ilumatobacteraceae bacterium]